MSTPTEGDPTAAVKTALKASGFPFQTRIRNDISNHKGYSVFASEYPWLNAQDKEEFLDIVATTKNFVLTIECKKANQDLLFLVPNGIGREIDDFLAAQVYDWKPNHLNPVKVSYDSVNVYPKSPTSEFCVTNVSGSSQRLLEKDASTLINGTDALAQNASEYHRLKQYVSEPYVLIPVLVSNSRIYKVEYDPIDVSLDTGQFEPSLPEIKAAPWMRFTKTFKVSKSGDHGYRSIFVVHSLALNEFLDALTFTA